MFPETLIVCINTHGIVPTNIENKISKPIMKKLDYPINIFKINATTYGVPFISNLNTTETICSKLKETVDALKTELLTPYQIALILRKQTESLNRENAVNLIVDLTDSHYVNLYEHYYDFMFTVIETKQDENYVEKLFFTFDEKKIQELEVSDGDVDYFNTIKLLNVNNTDLFELLTTIGFNQNQISFTELIDVLYYMTEMKNLIIVDLTCSTTEDDKRNDRRNRRELIRSGLY